MTILQTIRHFPGHAYQAAGTAAEAALSLVEKTAWLAIDCFTWCRDHPIVQEMVNPWIDRNITPLDLTDALIMIEGLALSIFAILALEIQYELGIAALPIYVFIGGAFSGAGFLISRSRVHGHFDELAWTQIDLMRKEASKLSPHNQDFTEIHKIRKSLDQPEFEHRKEDFKYLNDGWHTFQQSLSSPDSEAIQKIIQIHLDDMKQVFQGNDLAILEALEAAIKKVGAKDQDLAEIETQKLQLKKIQLPQHRQEIDELVKTINELTHAASSPNVSQSKRVFIEILEQLQRKLSTKAIDKI